MYAYHPSASDYSSDADSSQYSDGSGSGSGDGSGYSSDGSDGTDGSGNAYADNTADGTAQPNGTDAANGPNGQNSIEVAALQSGDEDVMNSATFDAFENKIDSALDRLKAKWNFGKDIHEAKDEKLTGREDSSEFSKWMKDIQKGDLVELPKDWKVKGLVQNLDLNIFAKGDKDAETPGAGSMGDVASLESFKEKLDDLSIRLGIDTGGFEAKINGMEQKIENRVAASHNLEAAGLTPTAERLKRVQDSGNAVIANQFSSDERATA
jgi:hypothetical protein